VENTQGRVRGRRLLKVVRAAGYQGLPRTSQPALRLVKRDWQQRQGAQDGSGSRLQPASWAKTARTSGGGARQTVRKLSNTAIQFALWPFLRLADFASMIDGCDEATRRSEVQGELDRVALDRLLSCMA
jgi:hypothetical protein